jgi:hypothetical protein
VGQAARKLQAALPLGSLNGYCFAVELGERKAVEGFVIGGSLISQDTDGDGLTEQERLITVRAPVQGSKGWSSSDATTGLGSTKGSLKNAFSAATHAPATAP